MVGLLASLGIALIAAWVVAMGAVHYVGMEEIPWLQNLLYVGLALAAAGAVASLVNRARGGRTSKRCVQCKKRVKPGQIYCDEHFRLSLKRVSDEAKAKR